MTELDVAWIAGLLEGEGCFFYRRTPMVKLQMTDEDIVARAATLTGKNYRKSKRPTVSGKHVFAYELHGEKAMALMRSILPFMGTRRTAKIKEVMAQAEGRLGIASGERCGQAKFTNAQAATIRQEYMANPYKGAQVALARQHGVSQAAMWSMLNGLTYRAVAVRK